MTAVEVPPAILQARKNSGPQRARLLPVERTLVVLLQNPGRWFVVDRFVRTDYRTGASPMWAALRRRGCDLRLRQVERIGSQQLVDVYARWTHDVPTEPEPVSDVTWPPRGAA